MIPLALPQPRRVAVIGGSRIPFARSDGPYATRLQPGDAHRRTGRSGRAVRASGAAGRRVRRRRRPQAQPGLQPGPRDRPRLGARPAHPRVRHPAGLRHRPPGRHRRRQQDHARRGRLRDRGRHGHHERRARSASTTSCADCCWRPGGRSRPAARIKALTGIRPRHLVPDIPRNAEPRTGLSMGEHAAVTARRWDIGRADAGPARRHQPPAARRRVRTGLPATTSSSPTAAWPATRTSAPAPPSEKLATLKPVFGADHPDATMTAGNSTPLTDGAATVLLASEEWAEAHGLEPLAYLSLYETAAVDYVGGDDGLLMAPAYAVPRMLERAGLDHRGLRPLRDPRGLRLPGARHPGRLGEAGARPGRPGQAQRGRIVARHRASVRRDRGADRRHPRRSCSPSGTPRAAD